ncbi:MAG: Maf family protein [Zetaproteobacteria bacterium]|nr:Maf family protein [Zetaproteobacteria bacterium]
MFDRLQIVLASTSPRRKELLQSAGIPFTLMPSQFEEKRQPGEPADKYVVRNACGKAGWVAETLQPAGAAEGTTKVVIGADTIVCLGDLILEKPKTHEQACEMLRMLSGQTHRVATGVAFFSATHNTLWKRTEMIQNSLVTFRTITQPEIERYVETGESMDKSGSYGIQGGGASFVAKIEGSYTNIMGLPLAECVQTLQTMETSSDGLRH